MKPRHNQSVTLLELLIAIVLLSVVVLGFVSIDTFSRYHILTSDRRAKVQNEVSFVLGHMTKNISKGIGDANQPAATISSIGTDPAVLVWIDANQNAKRDAAPQDYQIAYSFNDATHQIRYYANYTVSPAAYEVLSQKITGFSVSVAYNYVRVEITGCWNP
jgi:Tfp pilus assembly protein PilW